MREPLFPRAVLAPLLAALFLGSTASALAGVRAHWSFDEGSGTVVHDRSGNGFDARVRGATWVPGVRGTAMQFLPNGQIVDAIPPSVDNTVVGAFTIHAWLRWGGDHPGTYSPYSYVLDARTCSPCSRGFILFLARGGQVVLDVDSPSYQRFLGATPMPAGTWTHLAAVFDGVADSVWIYVNGARDVAHHATVSYVGTTLSPAIGNNRWCNGDGQYAPFNGAIDELMFVDHAMSAGEVHDAFLNLPPPAYTLEVTSGGHGSVAVAPDLPTYPGGTPVLLSPQPEPGHFFASWGGDTSGTDDPLALAILRDRAIVAEFSRALALSWTAGGHLVASPDQVAHAPGAPVSITAVPDDGWRFAGWDGDASGTANPAWVVMDRDRAVHGRFCLESGVAISVVGEGSVIRDPELDCYPPGGSVLLTAVPATGWRFDHWEGDLSGTANPETLPTDVDRSATAVFALRTYTLTVDVVGDGQVSRAPDLPEYPYGTAVTLAPMAAMGWCFEGWGATYGRLDPLELVMDADRHLTATFLSGALDTLHSYATVGYDLFARAIPLWPSASFYQRPLRVFVGNRCGDAVADIPVEVSFAACPAVALCRGSGTGPCPSPPERYRVCHASDASGFATFTLFGGGTSRGALAEVRVGGLAIARFAVASPDQDGDLAVTLADRDTFLVRYFADPTDPRIDLDGLGGGTSADLSILLAAIGRSCASAAGVEPPGDDATGYTLSSGRPNPSAGPAEVAFTLPVAATVRLHVLDASGRRVRTAHDGTPLPAGPHRWRWDGRDDDGRPARPGVYFVTLASELGTRSGTVVLVR